MREAQRADERARLLDAEDDAWLQARLEEYQHLLTTSASMRRSSLALAIAFNHAIAAIEDPIRAAAAAVS